MTNPPKADEGKISDISQQIWAPMLWFDEHKGKTTRDEINPNYLLPKQGLHRLQKIMDEYAGGWGSAYMTNRPMLERGLEHLAMFREDLPKLGAQDLHDLLRCWELIDRLWCGETHMRHLLYREETRWPGYYYRGDFPKLDDENWKVFVNSRYNRTTGEWDFYKRPFLPVID